MENQQKVYGSCKISIIVPLFNEVENLSELYQRLRTVMNAIGESYEFVFVDDGSSDGTYEAMLQVTRGEPMVKLIRLSRNFGKEIALTAGLDHTSGEFVVPLDADLQDPPELIPEMLALAEKGYDVVYGIRRTRLGESPLKKVTAYFFYKVLARLSDVEVPENTGDFRLIRREVVAAVRSLRERTRFMKGIFAWVGYRQVGIYYERQPRHAGVTKFNYWRLWNFALEGITGFSSAPLRLATYCGLLVAVVAMLAFIYFFGKALFWGDRVQGFPTLICTMFLMSGIQLMFLGILGEYVGRIFIETKNRPLYLVAASRGLEDRAGRIDSNPCSCKSQDGT